MIGNVEYTRHYMHQEIETALPSDFEIVSIKGETPFIHHKELDLAITVLFVKGGNFDKPKMRVVFMTKNVMQTYFHIDKDAALMSCWKDINNFKEVVLAKLELAKTIAQNPSEFSAA